jgi:hypothetical protein
MPSQGVERKATAIPRANVRGSSRLRGEDEGAAFVNTNVPSGKKGHPGDWGT